MSFLNRTRVISLSLLLALSPIASAEIVPVVSVKSSVGTMNKEQVVDIFLGKTRRFPNGDPVVPIDQAEGSAIRDAFYMQFANKTSAQIKAYWSKIIFTGRGEPPREVSPSERVKQVLAENPYSIGYIERSEVDVNVKVILHTR